MKSNLLNGKRRCNLLNGKQKPKCSRLDFEYTNLYPCPIFCWMINIILLQLCSNTMFKHFTLHVNLTSVLKVMELWADQTIWMISLKCSSIPERITHKSLLGNLDILNMSQTDLMCYTPILPCSALVGTICNYKCYAV